MAMSEESQTIAGSGDVCDGNADNRKKGQIVDLQLDETDCGYESDEDVPSYACPGDDFEPHFRRIILGLKRCALGKW